MAPNKSRPKLATTISLRVRLKILLDFIDLCSFLYFVVINS